MLEKMWHKRWMNLSLLLGCILLVATAVSFPLYQEAAYNRMLQDEFNNYLSSTGKWPAVFNMTIASRRDAGGDTINTMEELIPELYEELGVREKMSACYYYFSKNSIHSTLERLDAEGLSLRMGAKTDLADHIKILSGEMFSESGYADNGAIEAVISQKCMVELGLLVGETIEFDTLEDPDGNRIRLKITGVYEKAEENDYYWQDDFATTGDMCLINMDVFRKLFTGENAGNYTIICNYIAMFEYSDITSERARYVYNTAVYYDDESGFSTVIATPPFIDIFDQYFNKHARISATLTILQVPVLIMLAAFLLMISGQMYEMEKNEISVIKSRGSSRGQIFRLYLYQGMVLTGLGTVLGIPLGMAMSKMLGAARTFLAFDFNERLDVKFSLYSGAYALGAILLAIMCLTIPAIKHSKVSIVNLKQQNAIAKKPLWEKLYLDVILIAVAGYGYYSFSHTNATDMAENVLNSKSLDPLLYLSSSILIIGLGLLFLRLKTLLLKGIFNIGKKRWSPANFVSFTENVKNGRKQHLIMLFLIMTVSLGMYHSTVAGTIVENALKNTDYIDGTDVIIKEVWTEIRDRDGKSLGKFYEPDSTKYVSAPFVNKFTKVIYDDKGSVGAGKNSTNITLMGVHTREFGEITWVDRELNEEHYYNYLNKLAETPSGILVSSNFRDELGYKIGDSLDIRNFGNKSASGKILDFFDYWPGYAPTSLVQRPDGSVENKSNYMVVANINYLNEKQGVYPYEIWLTLNEGYGHSDIYNWFNENDVHLKKYRNRVTDLEDTKNDPLLQGTNGVLTMGFVVTILLCGVGYLIYWIMSLKERELVFGVLRASGFHKGELFHMLINEQIFCGILSVIAGFGIGKLTSTLFVPILQKAYATDSQVLPLVLYTNSADLVRLIAVIVGVMVVCLVTLTVMLLKMNVAKALKLGED
ncbi:MAG: ABC transporter permease [Lachnospiraceae bacterium]|nr:ABC transporter permease [Lachnospiraceae bacterium]